MKTLVIKYNLIDLYIDSEYGIFDSLLTKATTPMSEYITSDNVKSLDYLYYYGRSGDKAISRLYQRLIDLKHTDETLDDIVDKLADIVITRYSKKWNDFYNTISIEYDLENEYYYTKTETPDITVTTKNQVDTNSSTTAEQTNKVYGFNSEEGVNDTSSSGTSSTDQVGTSSEGVSLETGTRTTKEQGHKTGLQDTIQKELRLRVDNQLYELIFKDLDELLTEPLYTLKDLRNERIVRGAKGDKGDKGEEGDPAIGPVAFEINEGDLHMFYNYADEETSTNYTLINGVLYYDLTTND